MAIFEKSSQTKAILDDTEKLICSLVNAQNINKHTEYTLRVERGPTKESKWNVSRRYRDFATLHGVLQQANIELPLPPKKLIGNMHPSFVAERQIALQNYINEVLKHQVFALTSHVRCFLDPSNYPSTLAEEALQTVSIALRGDGRFELKGPMPDIGWRIRKHYFLVTDTTTRTNCLLSWQSYGLDRYLCDKDMQSAFKSLQSLSHPHIDQILAINSLETGAYVVRKIYENGSVRDMLYGTEYNKSYLAKYGNPKIRKPFTSGQIAHYGLQILQALKFLHDKGLPHGHIHPGNIVIEKQRVLITDVENVLLGGASLHRPYVIEHKRTCSAEAVDVHSFGRTLYEMAFAEPLTEPHRDEYPHHISQDLESVLRLCLSSASCKHQMPTLDHVSAHPFFTMSLVFSNGLHAGEARPHLRFTTALKEELRKAVTVVETRLRNDQKMVRSARRAARIQEILGSEEEMRKQKRKAKRRDSMCKSTSSLAETGRSLSVSTASSPTPPNLPAMDASNSTSAPSVSPATTSDGHVTATDGQPATSDGRSALLNAICNFDKSRLANVNSR